PMRRSCTHGAPEPTARFQHHLSRRLRRGHGKKQTSVLAWPMRLSWTHGGSSSHPTSKSVLNAMP
ncbi:hypothetical protein DFQ27_006001, partial [Actinomortierella ambigua]